MKPPKTTICELLVTSRDVSVASGSQHAASLDFRNPLGQTRFWTAFKKCPPINKYIHNSIVFIGVGMTICFETWELMTKAGFQALPRETARRSHKYLRSWCKMSIDERPSNVLWNLLSPESSWQHGFHDLYSQQCQPRPFLENFHVTAMLPVLKQYSCPGKPWEDRRNDSVARYKSTLKGILNS